MLFKVLTLLKLTLSDDIGGRLKALASTKLKVETRQLVNQATVCVRAAHTLHVGFEVSCDSQVGCVGQPRTRSVGYAGYRLLELEFESNFFKKFVHRNTFNAEISCNIRNFYCTTWILSIQTRIGTFIGNNG